MQIRTQPLPRSHFPRWQSIGTRWMDNAPCNVYVDRQTRRPLPLPDLLRQALQPLLHHD